MEDEPEYDTDFKAYAKQLIYDIYNKNYAPPPPNGGASPVHQVQEINPVLMHQLKKRRITRPLSTTSELDR
jgi:hypothetical protein